MCEDSLCSLKYLPRVFNKLNSFSSVSKVYKDIREVGLPAAGTSGSGSGSGSVPVRVRVARAR